MSEPFVAGTGRTDTRLIAFPPGRIFTRTGACGDPAGGDRSALPRVSGALVRVEWTVGACDIGAERRQSVQLPYPEYRVIQA